MKKCFSLSVTVVALVSNSLFCATARAEGSSPRNHAHRTQKPAPPPDISGKDATIVPLNYSDLNWPEDDRIPEDKIAHPPPEAPRAAMGMPMAAAAPAPAPAPVAFKMKDAKPSAPQSREVPPQSGIANAEQATEHLVDSVANKVDPFMRVINDVNAAEETVKTGISIVQEINGSLTSGATLSCNPVSVLPVGAHAMDLDNWNNPISAKYFKVEFNDLPSGSAKLIYRISARTGGQYNDHGHYISDLKVQVQSIELSDLYEVETTVSTGDAVNIANKADPVPSVDLTLTIKLKYNARILGFFTGAATYNVKSASFSVDGKNGVVADAAGLGEMVPYQQP